MTQVLVHCLGLVPHLPAVACAACLLLGVLAVRRVTALFEPGYR